MKKIFLLFLILSGCRAAGYAQHTIMVHTPFKTKPSRMEFVDTLNYLSSKGHTFMMQGSPAFPMANGYLAKTKFLIYLKQNNKYYNLAPESIIRGVVLYPDLPDFIQAIVNIPENNTRYTRPVEFYNPKGELILRLMQSGDKYHSSSPGVSAEEMISITAPIKAICPLANIKNDISYKSTALPVRIVYDIKDEDEPFKNEEEVFASFHVAFDGRPVATDTIIKRVIFSPHYPDEATIVFHIPENDNFSPRTIEFNSGSGKPVLRIRQAGIPEIRDEISVSDEGITLECTQPGTSYKLRKCGSGELIRALKGNGKRFTFMPPAGLYYITKEFGDMEIMFEHRINYKAPEQFDMYPHIETYCKNIVFEENDISRQIRVSPSRYLFTEKTLKTCLKNFSESQISLPWYKRVKVAFKKEDSFSIILECPPNGSNGDISDITLPFIFHENGSNVSAVIKPTKNLVTDYNVFGSWNSSLSKAKISLSGSQEMVEYTLRRKDGKNSSPRTAKVIKKKMGRGGELAFDGVMQDGKYCITVDYPGQIIQIGHDIILDKRMPGGNGRCNWIKTTTMLGRTASTSDITYLDGQGYPAQFIEIGASPRKEGGQHLNIVTPIFYDEACRKDARIYLPFVSENYTMLKEHAPLAAQETYYREHYNDSHAYIRNDFENSPLNRIRRTYNAGSAYQAETRPKFTSSSYETNKGEEVYMLKITGNGGLSVSGYHPPKILLKTISVDEDGKRSEVFTDMRGNKILERIRLDAGNKADTYYAYDIRNRLRWVLSPEGSRKLKKSAQYEKNSGFAGMYCYVYEYDAKSRLSAKSIPGKGWSFMIYDKGGRNILFQDEAMRKKKEWIYSVYDNLDRLRHRNIIRTELTPENIQRTCDTEGEKRLYPQLISRGCAEKPFSGNASVHVRKISDTFYDDYRKYGTAPGKTLPLPSALEFRPVNGVVSKAELSKETKNMKTYDKISVQGKDAFVERAYYYDRRGRIIQTVELNHLGGISRKCFKYDFTDNVVAEYESHKTSASSKEDWMKLSHVYDGRGRLLSDTVRFNNGIPAVTTYAYDPLGKLISIGKGTGNNAVTEHIEYDIRGRIRHKESRFFEMELRYENPRLGSKASYTGQISEWMWKHKATGKSVNEYTYGFSYDALNRFRGNKQYFNGKPENRYTEDISYDLNGNPLALKRSGSGRANYSSFAYEGNRMVSFRDGDRTYKYEYDANGNCTKDGMKNLILEYNHLNLPEKIKSGNTLKAVYSWSAEGTKLGVSDAAGYGRYYMGNLIYAKDAKGLRAEAVIFPGGLIRVASDGSQEINYFLCDHLGSVRVIFNAGGKVVERNDYYVSGKAVVREDYPRQAGNRYKYNGKEEQTTGNLGYLDYGARMYETSAGRWLTVDPMAESYYSVSPYAYCANNPVNFIDPDGRNFTHYVDRNYNILLQTNDGSNNVVMVPDEKIRDFKFFGNSYDKHSGMRTYYDSPGWNMHWVEEFGLAPRQLSEGEVSVLSLYHGNKAQNAAVGFMLKPTAGNMFKTAGLEVLAQWRTPELLAGGVSIGISALSSLSALRAAKGGAKTTNGLKITGFTSHGMDRAIGSFGRTGVKPDAILDALKNPLKINNVVIDQLGRQSQRFIGQFGEVVINPQTGKIISVNPTSSSKAAKL